MKTTPYDTGKVKIGCNYTPPRRMYEPTRTESMLQTALIGGESTDWDGIVIAVFIAALVASPFLVVAWRSL